MQLRRTSRYLVTSALVLTYFLFSVLACADTEVIKSANDQREYAAFTLSNKLKVLVVSDPETDRAAAALDVHVGTSSDPNDRQGLAHFLEHMLFLGTKKYPQPGEYQAFISSHGGRHNAYTSFEHTNYFFDVDKDNLEPALDRFAQFFVAPLFTPQYVDREKNAVNAEYQIHKKDDGRRAYAARKHAVNPNHPFARFDIGSLDTLTDRGDSKVRDELIRFYERHYSANLMALVVIGKEPIPKLRQWVVEKFSAVRNVNARPLETKEPLFADGQLPARLNVVPLEERRVMSLTFPIPSLTKHYRSKPVGYIGHLLGHEGRGSLLSLLKARGWVDALSAGAGMDNRNEATFEVSMNLTQEGLAHPSDIAAAVFQYIDLINEKGVERWIFDEQKKLGEIGFRFQEKFSPLRYASALASRLHVYPPKDVIRGAYAMDVYDAELIRRFLDRLTPANVLITINATGVKTEKKDPWFGTSYKLTRLDTTTTQRWAEQSTNPELAIPAPNPFLPDDLALKPPTDVGTIPSRIREARGLSLWFQQDETFRVPRASFYFSVRSPAANDSPRHAMLTALYVAVVDDQLGEFSYPAYIAGLDFSLYRHMRGFSVRISGYNNKQELLLSRIVATLAAPKVDPKRFAIIKDDLEQGLRNVKRDRPYTQTMSEITKLLVKPHWTEEQRLEALQSITAKDLQQFIPKLLDRVDIVALAHGNVVEEEGLQLARVLEGALLKPAKPATVPPGRVVKLPDATRYLRELDVDHPDSALTLYLQADNKAYTTRAKVGLIAQVLSSPFYNDLRTEKQLGYVVFATAMPLLEVPGLAFVIQSPNADAIALQTYVQQFVAAYTDEIAGMDETSFQKHKTALLTGILKKEERLKTRSNRYWREIDREHYQFDTRERLAEAVRGITKKEFEVFYKEFLLGQKRKVLVVRSIGTKHTASMADQTTRAQYTLIQDPVAFKKDKHFFPG